MTAENEGTELYNQFEVLVCTGALLFRGTSRGEFSQRLIDALNEGVRTDTSSEAVDFLPLMNVSVTGIQGGEKKIPRMYIAKSNIIFAAQVSGNNQGKPLSGYPFKEKLPVIVMAHIAVISNINYTLEGQIYVDTWGQVIDTIESNVRFIPLTQVKIEPALPGAGSRYDFVALNKEHIISIWESPGQ
jgi:hypothetical protein